MKEELAKIIANFTQDNPQINLQSESAQRSLVEFILKSLYEKGMFIKELDF